MTTTDNNQTADVLNRADGLRRQADRARTTYAQTLAALLAEYIQEMFPQADAVVFDTSTDASTDTGIDARLLMIGHGDAVLWTPATIINPGPELSTETVACIETALERAYDADPDVFESRRDYPGVGLNLLAAYEDWYPAAGPLTGHTYHGHAVLEALASAADIGRTEEELCAEVGPVLWFADIPALTAHGYVTVGDINDGFRYRITPAGVMELARAYNQAATFLPTTDNPGPCEDGGQYPALTVVGAQVYGYVDKHGTLRVSVHLDSGDIPAWLHPEGSTGVPLTITVNGVQVFTSNLLGQ